MCLKIESGMLDETRRKILYTCTVNAAEIDKPDVTIRGFNGTHLTGKCHKEVEALHFIKCKMEYFHRGVQNIFPHLRGLQVFNCGLTILGRSDLDGLQSLEVIEITYNQLESLPSNLLVGMSNL